MQLRLFVALTIIAVVLLSVACGDEQGPTEVMKAFLNAIDTFDLSTAEGLVCETQRDKVRDILEPFGEATGMTEAFDLGFDELSFQEQSNDGSVAVVHVTGTLWVSFLGQQERQAVNEEHVVIRRDGRWMICDP